MAEWNIWVDPIAAHEVFASGLPLHLVPLDATDQVPWTESDASVWAASGSPESMLAADILEGMLQSWGSSNVYLWDLVAAVAMTDARFCQEVPLALDVVTEAGPEQGRTVVGDGSATAGVCLEPDAGQIRTRVAGILGRK